MVVFTGGGFEPGDVAPILARAVRSDSPLPANPTGFARLEAGVAAALNPPAPKLSPPLPEIAERVSGKKYALEPNPLGLTALSIEFSKDGTASADITFTDGRSEERPLGLDGVPRLSPVGRFGLPVGLRGSWTAEDVFKLHYDEIANINCFQLRLTFEGDRVESCSWLPPARRSTAWPTGTSATGNGSGSGSERASS